LREDEVQFLHVLLQFLKVKKARSERRVRRERTTKGRRKQTNHLDDSFLESIVLIALSRRPRTSRKIEIL